MFWNNFVSLCLEHNTKPNPVAKELGLSSGSVTRWKQGSIPNDTTLKKIADYFGVNKDDLLLDPLESANAPDSSQLPPLATEFYDLVDQLTLKELREIQATMKQMIKNRRS